MLFQNISTRHSVLENKWHYFLLISLSCCCTGLSIQEKYSQLSWFLHVFILNIIRWCHFNIQNSHWHSKNNFGHVVYLVFYIDGTIYYVHLDLTGDASQLITKRIQILDTCKLLNTHINMNNNIHNMPPMTWLSLNMTLRSILTIKEHLELLILRSINCQEETLFQVPIRNLKDWVCHFDSKCYISEYHR